MRRIILSVMVVVGALFPATAAHARGVNGAAASWSCSIDPAVATFDSNVATYVDVTITGPTLAFFDFTVTYDQLTYENPGVQELYPAETATEHLWVMGTGNPVTVDIWAFGNHRFSHRLTSCYFVSEPAP